MTHRRQLCGALGAVAILAASTAADQNAVVRTHHDEIAEVLAFEQTFVVDAYKQHGRRDPRWDADAVALLEAQIRASRNDDDAGRFYALPDVMPLAQRRALADRVMEAGCDDAIVLYHAGLALREAREMTTNAFRRAATAAPTSPYASVYKLLIAHAAQRGGGWRSDVPEVPAIDPAVLQAEYETQLRATLVDPELLPAHRLPVWIVAKKVLSPSDEDESLALGKVIEPLEGSDPWLHNLLMGIVEVRRAWHARGGGFANTVTEDGWKQFAAHLVAARGRFQKAIEADDRWPQPFSQMITVAMGESSGHERAWFEHSIARQSDFKPAIGRYLDSLLPRWGGSHVEMFEAGVRAVDAGRFDTRMPAMLLLAIEQIEKESPLDARQERRVYPAVVKCLDGYIAQSPLPDVRRWARSARAAWAMRVERWDEAHAQFTALAAAGEAVDVGPFHEHGLNPVDAAEEAAVRGGPLAKEFAEAIEQPIAVRAAALSSVIAKLEATDPARRWAVTAQCNAELTAGLATGEWFRLPIPTDLAGTRALRGTWRVDAEGALIGVSEQGPMPPTRPTTRPATRPATRPRPTMSGGAPMSPRPTPGMGFQRPMTQGLMLVLPLDLPQRYELRFTMEAIDGPPDRPASAGVATSASLTRGSVGRNTWVSATPERGIGGISGSIRGSRTENRSAGGSFELPESGTRTTITLRVVDDGVSVIGADGAILAEATPSKGGDGTDGVIRDSRGNVAATIDIDGGGPIFRDARGRVIPMPGLSINDSHGGPPENTRRLAFGSQDRRGGVIWRFSDIQIRAVE